MLEDSQHCSEYSVRMQNGEYYLYKDTDTEEDEQISPPMTYPQMYGYLRCFIPAQKPKIDVSEVETLMAADFRQCSVAELQAYWLYAHEKFQSPCHALQEIDRWSTLSIPRMANELEDMDIPANLEIERED